MHLLLTSPRTLAWEGETLACAIGPAGVRRRKVEGDQATPAGRFPLRRVLYRPDRIADLETRLPAAPLREGLGWCDDPRDPAYNSMVALPYEARCEKLWRPDHLYDVIVVVGFNDNPPRPGRGSAIFLHLAHDDFRPTQGCVALGESDLRRVLRTATRETHLVVPDTLATD